MQVDRGPLFRGEVEVRQAAVEPMTGDRASGPVDGPAVASGWRSVGHPSLVMSAAKSHAPTPARTGSSSLPSRLSGHPIGGPHRPEDQRTDEGRQRDIGAAFAGRRVVWPRVRAGSAGPCRDRHRSCTRRDTRSSGGPRRRSRSGFARPPARRCRPRSGRAPSPLPSRCRRCSRSTCSPAPGLVGNRKTENASDVPMTPAASGISTYEPLRIAWCRPGVSTVDGRRDDDLLEAGPGWVLVAVDQADELGLVVGSIAARP